MGPIMTNRTYHVNGTWYAPQKKLEEMKSVVEAELTDTTSSAGDWSGYFVQKVFRTYYLIEFSQQNDYPEGRGFTLLTAEEPTALFDHKPEREEIANVLFPND